jgi:hypothetical protein
VALLACGAGFLSGEFVSLAIGMGGSAAQGGYFALALPVHRGKTPLGTNGLDVFRFDFHGHFLLYAFSDVLNG